MVSTRPTESYEWAEGTPPAIDGTNPPTDPGAGRRSSGYGFEERLPHESFNWVVRTIGRWIGWLEEKVDGHVHDGGASEASVAKVDVENHIDYGNNGGVVVETDSTAAYKLVLQHLGAGVARFATDILASGTLFVDGVKSGPGQLVNPEIVFEDGSGAIIPNDIKVLIRGWIEADYFDGANAPKVSLRRDGSGVETGYNGAGITLTEAGTPTGSVIQISDDIPESSAILVTPIHTSRCFATVFRGPTFFSVFFYDDAGIPVVPADGFSLLVFY